MKRKKDEKGILMQTLNNVMELGWNSMKI